MEELQIYIIDTQKRGSKREIIIDRQIERKVARQVGWNLGS
jgi:hypothetical protein